MRSYKRFPIKEIEKVFVSLGCQCERASGHHMSIYYEGDYQGHIVYVHNGHSPPFVPWSFTNNRNSSEILFLQVYRILIDGVKFPVEVVQMIYDLSNTTDHLDAAMENIETYFKT